MLLSGEELTDVISRIITDSSIDIAQSSHIMFGRDTRLVLVLCLSLAHMVSLICSCDHFLLT